MAPNTVAGQGASSATGSIPETPPELTFLVEISGVTIGQFCECTGLSVEYEVMEYAEGGNNDFVRQAEGTSTLSDDLAAAGCDIPGCVAEMVLRQSAGGSVDDHVARRGGLSGAESSDSHRRFRSSGGGQT